MLSITALTLSTNRFVGMLFARKVRDVHCTFANVTALNIHRLMLTLVKWVVYPPPGSSSPPSANMCRGSGTRIAGLTPMQPFANFWGISGTSGERYHSEIFGRSFLGWERGGGRRGRGSKNFWGISGIQGHTWRGIWGGGWLVDDDSM